MAEKIEEMVKPVPSEEEKTPVEDVSKDEGATEENVADESKEDDKPVIKDEPSADEVQDGEEKEVAEEPTEEPVAESEEEPVKEDPVVEEPAEDDNLKKIEEQLSIISEVRQELSNAYKSHQEDVKTIESLQSQIRSLESKSREANKNIEQLNGLVDEFKTKEAEANSIAYATRLEKLSANFSRLGQNKSVEQLSNLSEEVIKEFESVTAMALDYKSEEKLDSVTAPTQSTPQTTYTPVKKVSEKIDDKDFLRGVLNTLAGQQGKAGSDGKRIINM